MAKHFILMITMFGPVGADGAEVYFHGLTEAQYDYVKAANGKELSDADETDPFVMFLHQVIEKDEAEGESVPEAVMGTPVYYPNLRTVMTATKGADVETVEVSFQTT
jgi:hypothetical protein